MLKFRQIDQSQDNHQKCQKSHFEIVSSRQDLSNPELWLVVIAKNGSGHSRSRIRQNYIIPIPPGAAGIAGVSSLIVETTDSVVRSVDATLFAFCSALLVTLAGSRIPSLTIST